MRGWYARESRKSALEYSGGDYANLLFLPLWGMRLASSALGKKPQRSLRELDSGAAAGSEARGPRLVSRSWAPLGSDHRARGESDGGGPAGFKLAVCTPRQPAKSSERVASQCGEACWCTAPVSSRAGCLSLGRVKPGPGTIAVLR